MKCPRPRSVQCSLLGIPLALLAALLWLLCVSGAQAEGVRQGAPARPEADWSYPAKFVGQDHVDLKWEPDPYYPVWILYRDNAELKRFDATVTFYRDRGVVKGQTYEYKVCPATSRQPCGQPSTVTVGQIHGLLYEYLSWAGDTYQLSGEVTVQPGATLHIGGGATVSGAWDAEIRDFYPGGGALGAIQVDGATIQARLDLKNGSSGVEGSTIGGNAPGWVYLSEWAGGALSGNTFTSTGVFDIYCTSGQEVQVQDNTFHDAWLYARGAGQVSVHGNRFEKGSSVQVEGTVTGAVSGNTFHDSSIAVSSTGYYDVNNNRLRLLEWSDGALIVVSSHAPNVGIHGNVLDGFMEGVWGGRGVGILAGADVDSGGIVDIHDNIVTELERGISLAGPIRVLVYNNTITHNRTGILVHHWDTIPEPDVAITGNCISGNNRTANSAYAGLTTVGVVTPIAARGNYWGHLSGPTHPDNPGGQGDLIQELDMDWGPVPDPGVVDFSGWLEAHHCSEVDLSVAGVEVVQSIQDLNNSVPLVAGKAALVRIYADSGMAPEVAGVPVELKVSRDGSLLGSKQGMLLSRPVTKWDQVRASIDQVVASAHAPQVTLLSPNTGGLKRGKIDVQWTAQDADAGDELAFGLSYSTDDGATWLPFAVNLTGPHSFELDLGNLPGGTACRVKVDVSDGWHNASDVSDTSFEVPGKAPIVGISWPTDGAVVTMPLTLVGYGYDLEDGQLSGTSLAWTSDRDGALGTGDTVWDVALTPGQHTLTLQAADSDGATRSVAVVITVGEQEPDREPIYLPIVVRHNSSDLTR